MVGSMDMIVVFGGLFVGLAAAFIAQIVVSVFNVKSQNESPLVGGAFAVAMLASGPYIAKIVGV